MSAMGRVYGFRAVAKGSQLERREPENWSAIVFRVPPFVYRGRSENRSSPMSNTLDPKLQKLYLCRYGFNGATQICLLGGIASDGSYKVRKWRANSARWTAPVAIAKRDLVAVATRDECVKAGVNVASL